MKQEFSRNHPQEEYVLTPYGAAVVEALPNRKRFAQVHEMWKKGQCFTSRSFTTVKSVEVFYADIGEKVEGLDV